LLVHHSTEEDREQSIIQNCLKKERKNLSKVVF
jgi:hypothetical protein